MPLHRWPIPVLLLLALTISIATSRANDTVPTNKPPALDVPQGFRVERLYVVPREQGSWISMAFDPRGRLIVSHEGGGLYRITLAASPESAVRVDKLQVKIAGAHGLLYAFDSLYAVAGGLLRLRDTNGDDQFDKVESLIRINGRGEHGPHAVVLGPQKKWLYIIAGNATKLPQGLTRDRVSGDVSQQNRNPQGWVMRITPDGKTSELFSVGLRNSFGLAFNPAGELFTFDSDNEGFMNLPWYRPTNIYHIVSGADFGWRQGPETLQSYHHDNLPPVLEVGPGSPTGMVFGTGTSFPAKYQRALFVNDWSYGRIYAIHLRPDGASYRAEQEFFISGRPLAVTDIRVGPDGAMYFLTGGRGTQSALYRITWQGNQEVDTPKQKATPTAMEARQLRKRLEQFHGRRDTTAVATAWPHLRSQDRFIRYAARVAVEHQQLASWKQRALDEQNSAAVLEATLALARQAVRNLGATDSQREQAVRGGDPSLRSALIQRLTSLSWQELTRSQQLALLRSLEVTLTLHGSPSRQDRSRILALLDHHYPHRDDDLNRELVKLLVLLRAENLVERTITVLRQTPTAMRQIHFLLELDRLKIELTDDQRKRLVATLDLDVIRDTATRPYKDVAGMVTSLLRGVGVSNKPSAVPKPAKLVKNWALQDLMPLTSMNELKSGNLQNGRTVFRKAQCHSCHRVGSSGGVLGPNLTGLSGRFQPREVLESIVDPDKVIADQYRTMIFEKTNGKRFTGQIVNLSKGVIQIRLDPLRPFPRVSFPEQEIERIRLSKVSLMPKGTLNYLTREEIRDLLAYLLERR